MEDDFKRKIIGILIVSIISLLSLSIYLIFFKLDRIKNDMEEIIVTQEKVVNQYDKLVGIYEYSGDEKNIRLAIYDDGTGEYQLRDSCGESVCTYEDVIGIVSIGKNKIFLLNEECDNNNCRLVVTFDYYNEIIKIDDMTLNKK